MAVKTKAKRSVQNLPIVIIGGGPAGMTAAKSAAEFYGNIILFDKNPVPGKKLNSFRGRQLLLSEKLSPEKTASAFGSKKDFILPAIKSFGWEKMQAQLNDLGFKVGQNGDRGLVLPSEDIEQFSSKLKDAAVSAGVIVKKSSRVSDIVISGEKVTGVVVNGVTHPASAVIIASGSFSSPKAGSTKDGYVMAEKTGHAVSTLKSAIVGFETVEKLGKILSSVHIKDCRMEVFLDDNLSFSDRGDTSFSSSGIEGDLIYLHSTEISELLDKGKVRIQLDLLPDYSRLEVERILGQDLDNGDRTTVWQILTRYVPDRMLDVMHKMIRVHCRKPAVTLSKLERKLLAIWVKDFSCTIRRPRPFNETVGITGGVSVDDIDPKTMRSKKIKNLYFAGEVLDLLGPWGGYNLEMAFSTGHLAGISAGKSGSSDKKSK